jgi:hypothetical protein
MLVGGLGGGLFGLAVYQSRGASGGYYGEIGIAFEHIFIGFVLGMMAGGIGAWVTSPFFRRYFRDS